MDNAQFSTELSDGHARAIGLTIAKWSAVEKVLTFALADLIANRSCSTDDSDFGPLVSVTGKDVRVTIGLIKMFASYRSFKNATEISLALDRINKLKGDRDLIAHAIWMRTQDPAVFKAGSWKTVGGFKDKSRLFTEGQILDIGARAHDEAATLIRLLNANQMLLFLSEPSG